MTAAAPITPIVERCRFDRPRGTVRFGPEGVRYVLTAEQMRQLAADLTDLADQMSAEWFADGYAEER